jgi:hypothetical protein
VGASEDLRQRALRLGVLRSLQEPLWQVVLDGGVRQQGQDPGVPPAHLRAGGLEALRTANTRPTDGKQPQGDHRGQRLQPSCPAPAGVCSLPA